MDAAANKSFADTAAVPGPPPPRTSATVRVRLIATASRYPRVRRFPNVASTPTTPAML
ncbi:Uncharacterised protein [Mycobacteroides abscessus subsp. abscessus]|nr:Uncharacterised protein [Mycobacteroides abscessus subsp. abscessus]